MKPTIIFRCILGAIGAATISAAPSFAQTTSVPITSGTVNGTYNIGSGVGAFTSGTVLTGFGPITFTAITGNTTISSPPGLGSTVSTIGTADGNLNGTTGGVVGGSFATAPLTISGTISTASLNAPGTILSLSATGATGSITLPNSILAVTPTPTPTPTPLKTLTNEQSKVIIVALLKSDEEIGRRRDRGNFRSRRSSLGQSRISGYLSTVIFGMIDGFDQQD